jgi:hypothetical protein
VAQARAARARGQDQGPHPLGEEGAGADPAEIEDRGGSPAPRTGAERRDPAGGPVRPPGSGGLP